MEEYEKSGKKLEEIRKFAPKSTSRHPKTGKQLELCLSWHLKGSCYNTCQQGRTHRKLAASEIADTNKFVKEHCRD